MPQNSRAFSPVNPEKMFKLANGMTISTIRQLLNVLESLDDETFLHHVNSRKNDFATWIRDVFEDEKLAGELQYLHNKEQMISELKKRIIELEQEELQNLDITETKKELLEIENKIAAEIKLGVDVNQIKQDLLSKNYPAKEIDFILENIKSPYKDIKNINDIENLEHFQKGLTKFKKYVMESVLKGRSLEEIEKYLEKSGWNETIIKMLLYDVYKAHNDMEKLSKYIRESMAKGVSVQNIKLTLMQMGWKEYVINSVLYGIHNPSKNLGRIVSYLGSVDNNDRKKIEKFLTQLGWNDSDIEIAFKENEHRKLERTLEKDFNILTGFDLVEVLKIVNKGVAEIADSREGDTFLKHLKNALEYRKLKLSDFFIKQNEMYSEPSSQHYYNLFKLEQIEKITGKKIRSVLFANPTAPIIIETRPKYIIAAELLLKKCVYCGKMFRMDNLEKIMKWDDTKTHKVAMFVCKEHFPIVKGFFEEKLVVNK